MTSVTVRAHPNIALIKYWGKRDEGPLNLPAVGSISVTLGGIYTETTLSFAQGSEDVIYLDGAPATGSARARMVEHLDLLRSHAQEAPALELRSVNTFPTAAGLASSASGFGALTLAGARLLELPQSLPELTALARQGSGSASRSLHGGFVEGQKGEASDGSDSIAIPLAPADWWDLRIHVAILAQGPKKVGSRAGMARSRETSAFYGAWVAEQEADLAAGRAALLERDFSALAEAAERSCMKMVSTWFTASPTLHYWRPETLGVIQAVQGWRGEGLPVFFTTDAGPHVKVICPGEASGEVLRRLEALPSVQRVLSCPVGGPAAVLSAVEGV